MNDSTCIRVYMQNVIAQSLCFLFDLDGISYHPIS